jgi:hypothetical protein
VASLNDTDRRCKDHGEIEADSRDAPQPGVEMHNPNPVTLAAMAELKAGHGRRFNHAKDLFEDLKI